MWNQRFSLRDNETMDIVWKTFALIFVAEIVKCWHVRQTPAEYIFLNPIHRELKLFFLIEGLTSASFIGVRRRHWPIPIGWAPAVTHSSALKQNTGTWMESFIFSSTHVPAGKNRYYQVVYFKHLEFVASSTRNQSSEVGKLDKYFNDIRVITNKSN